MQMSCITNQPLIQNLAGLILINMDLDRPSLNVSLIADMENYLLDHCIEYGFTYSTCTLFELNHENEW